MLDRHADAMNRDIREDLGIWIRSCLKNGVEARTLTAMKELAGINITKGELRKEWEAQKAAQLSVRKRESPHCMCSHRNSIDRWNIRCAGTPQEGARLSVEPPSRAQYSGDLADQATG